MKSFNSRPLSEQLVLLNGPALRPPVGVVPNFSDPPNWGSLGVGLVISSCAITGLLVMARLYVRAFYYRVLHIEDYGAAVTLCVLGGYHYFNWKIIHDPGLFVHQWNVRLKDMPNLLYLISSSATVYGIIIMLLKANILLHWTHIFVPKGVRNGFWWICHVTIWINVLFYSICTFIEIFACTPRKKIWNPMMDGRCLDMKAVNLSSAVINFLSDVIIFALPQQVIWGLRMTKGKKLGVAALFAAGILAIICAGFRIKSTLTFNNSDDVVYNMSAWGLWCFAEMTAGFFVLCLPGLPRLFRESPWIRKIISTLRSITGFTPRTSTGTSYQQSTSWPQSRPNPVASTNSTTDAGLRGFLPLGHVEGRVDVGRGLEIELAGSKQSSFFEQIEYAERGADIHHQSPSTAPNADC